MSRCNHEYSERIMAVDADGMCPLCLAYKLLILQNEQRKIMEQVTAIADRILESPRRDGGQT